MATQFEATTRLPFRPLSYENVEMAYNRELIADYTTGNLYLKDDNGEIIDLTEKISQLIIESGDISQYLNVTYTGFDGEETTVTINAAVIDVVNKIKEQQEVIDAITGQEGGGGGTSVTIQIKPTQIVTDENHRFLTDTQINEITNKVSITDVVCLLPATGWIGSEAPYYQTVACQGALETMPRPTIDINHTASESYETAMDAEDAWCYIYRATTGANTITVYASEKPEVDISMVVQLKLPGLTPAPSETSVMSETNAVVEETAAEDTTSEMTGG